MNGARALDRAVALWFAVVIAGQWAFIGYLAAHYLMPAMRGGLAAWAGNNLATGYAAGDAFGNGVVATHIFLASAILASGQIQLLPKLRAQRPLIHRWGGRFFVFGAIIASLTGLYMVWARGNPKAGLAEHIGTSLGAVLTVGFAAMTLRAAIARDIAAHRKWALRLFMTVSGVWFIRVGYGLWFFAHGGPTAASKAFTIFISYAQYAIPLTLLESYLWVRARGGDREKRVLAGVLIVVSALTAIGLYEVAAYMWLPRIL